MTPREEAPVTVTQADRDAVRVFHRTMAEKLMADIMSGEAPTFGDDAGHDGDTIHQAFARHRTQAAAAAKAREEELEAQLVWWKGEAKALAEREAEYRKAHDLHGDGSSEAGRAWDLMRRQGDRIRAALSASDGEAGDED